MPEGEPKKLLNRDIRRQIYNKIYEEMLPDDRLPSEVIQDPDSPFKGNERLYLITMARWHGIPLLGEQKTV